MAVSIDVYGSCVSRDLFRYTGIGKYELKRCVTQIPITSLYERPVHLQEEEFAGTAFSRREQMHVRLQGERILPSLLKKDKSEYLIIDLADELMQRSEILIGDEGGYTTQLALAEGKQEEYKKLLDANQQYSQLRIYPPTQLDQLRNEKKYRKFAQDILCSKQNPEGYRPDQVIILEALYSQNIMANSAVLKTHAESYHIKESNDWLRRQYDAFEQAMPDCCVIRFPEFVHSTPNHKNGVHPLHYMAANYAYFERALDVAVHYSDTNTLENLYAEQSLQNKLETRVVNTAMMYNLEKQVKELQQQVQKLQKLVTP